VNRRGATSLEFVLWIIGALGIVGAYAHNTFITYREVAPRLDRIESKLDDVLKAKNER
jgi:hypothetical protein